jgi:pyridoxine 4-dehydrogenase
VQGLIRHLGLSTVDADQLAEAQAIAPVVCVQNFYNVARREDEALVGLTARQGIAYVPYFPLGGFASRARRRWRTCGRTSPPRR